MFKGIFGFVFLSTLMHGHGVFKIHYSWFSHINLIRAGNG